ncbi:MAG TPA: hypothetical protein VL426_06295 [Candidatus Binatia bacterium]|jgi:hypothetical protein|nr:hypothetical protein [Candidatus Binatia bacterium]
MNDNKPRDDGRRIATWLGIALFVFGAVAPGMLFPKENQILVGFIGAPFILFGVILLLIGAFPTQRLDDRRKDDDDKPDGGLQ